MVVAQGGRKKTDTGEDVRINMGLGPHRSSHHTAATNSIRSIVTASGFAGFI